MRILSLLIFFALCFYKNDYAQSQHGDTFDIDCSYCHDSESWKVDLKNVTFDHSTTKFELTGQHNNVDCQSCHTTFKFSETSSECISCHKDIHTGTAGAECSHCHTPDNWIVKDILNIHQISRFPLAGNHKTADCQQCHSNYTELNFEPIGINCIDCHSADYLGAQNPNHVSAGFSKDCSECHSLTAVSWKSANLAHDFFPLEGGHNISNCFSCHEPGGNFSGLSQDCYSCHKNDFSATQNPNHTQAGFTTDCRQCHTIYSFIPSTFDHNLTNFPLTGRHVTVNCTTCHASGYSGTPTECVSCHLGNYNSTSNPNHIAAGFPNTCKDCHSTSAWQPAQFDHDGQYFPIYSGKHKDKWNICSDCHRVANNFNLFSCIDCHEHRKSEMDDKHSGVNGYIYESTACLSCHPTGRKEGAFNHNNTDFILTGAHNLAECSQCHQSGYSGTTTICFGCHNADYGNSVNPNHTVLSLPTDCNSCHTTNPGWSPAAFPVHNEFFVLAGRHMEIANDCNLCHNGNFVSTPNQCIGCHQAAYNNAQNPNHIALGIPTECSICHNSVAWIPSTFDHMNTGFPLTGAHLVLNCSECHQSGYSGTASECISCHLDDYNSTLNPNHTTAGFPVTCQDCHTTNGWLPAQFNHDGQYFPIYSGKHKDKWNSCSDCHIVQNNYSIFSCIDCHEHNQQQTDLDHSEVPGYVYESTACLSCHPNGNSKISLPQLYHDTDFNRPGLIIDSRGNRISR